MAFWKIISVVITASIIVDASQSNLVGRLVQKRAVPSTVNSLCNTLNSTNRVQCFCNRDKKDPTLVINAECYLTQQNVAIDDRIWNFFKTLEPVYKITLQNTRGIPMTYIPTAALKETTALKKLEVKYGLLNTIEAFAFANHSLIQEITLRDDQIVKLDENSFSHLANLKMINLDTNSITEINRNVFVDLPSLEKLFLTSNQISTIHDKAFINLISLKELEIDRNKIFSLNYAVFEGLNNLLRLDLSSNSLEVIGDNTFQTLVNLKVLNLEGNSIQMLDDKAFHGLSKLRSLSLAHNKLTAIDNVKVFDGLDSLTALSLKGNQLKELKEVVMAPIMRNLYRNSSSLDVEDNTFPCDCRLDWFTSVINKTLNRYLKTTLENLKCIPDAQLMETWTNAEKSAPQELEEEGTAEYEFYDDSSLDGKLFYIDVRYLLNCDNKTDITSVGKEEVTKDNTSPTSTSVVMTTHRTPNTDAPKSEGTVQTTTQKTEKAEMNTRVKSEVNKQEEFTTTRLATVSAKPVEAKIYENMASDEAKPDRIKAHRSVQEENNPRRAAESHTSNANEKLSSVKLLLLMVLICFRLHI